MSTQESEVSHLQQRKLNDKAQNLLQTLATWLSSTAVMFKPYAEEFENCVDPQMHDKVEPLLIELGLAANKGISVVRIPGPKPALFYNRKGPAYLIPIRVGDGNSPTASGCPLKPGESTYITAGVHVAPKLDLLFVLL